jgi:hypothetical protein
MDAFLNLFGPMLVFVYHCFDRIVINGYLSMLSRPDQVVYFFKNVVGHQTISKEVLSEKTTIYKSWIESFVKNNGIPLEWAEHNVRKEDYVRPFLKNMERHNRFGVYFILKSMEQGNTFRSVKPKFKSKDPTYRIIKKNRSRFTHYYFYIRDEKIGAMSIRVASFLPFQVTCYLNGHNFIERELISEGVSFRKNDNAFVSSDSPEAIQKAADKLTPEIIAERLDHWLSIIGPKFTEYERKKMNINRFYAMSQIEYCTNFIFKRNNPIHKIFQRACELSFFTLTASKVSNIFGFRVDRRFKGKLQSVLERLDSSHHTLRAYFKNSFIKQYEKLRTFLRIEVCSNNTYDLRVKKSLDNMLKLKAVTRDITDRFATLQTNMLNVHTDFPLFQKLALPITQKNTKIPGIKIHDTRMIRLMETVMHAGNCLDGWSSSFIHQTIISKYNLQNYTINQLRYDLRKLKAHSLVERNGNHYTYRLTKKGMKVSSLFVLFHKRLCGPLANSLFHFRPNPKLTNESKLEKAYQKADRSIEKIVEILAA